MQRPSNSFVFLFGFVVLTGCTRADKKLVDFVTFKIGVPSGSRIIASKRDSGFAQDAKWYLIFDSTPEGVIQFAEDYSDGIPIDKYGVCHLDLRGGEYQGKVAGIPWDLTRIERGRYFQRNDTNGFVSIDLVRNRVYVFR